MSLLLAVLAGAVLNGAPVIGDRLEPFTIQTREGQPYSWAPKRATVISFCAFWCDTWKDQLPRVREAQSALSGLPIDFLTVSVDGRWSEKGLAAAVGKNLSDPAEKWTSRIGIDRVPYTLFVDSGGIVRWASFGVVRSQDLVKAVRASAVPRVSGTVYLTFDDFPSEKGSDELLDALRAAKVPATFFCVCSRVNRFSAIMRRTVREGHRLAIHAWNHDETNPDLPLCESALSAFGPAPDLYRPPGSESIFTLARKVIPLHVSDPYDYKRPGAQELVRRISHEIQSGGVVQLHAGVQDTIDAIPEIVSKLRQRGMIFKRLAPNSQ